MPLVLAVPLPESKFFLNEWTIHIPKGIQVANEFAQENGHINLGEIVPNSGYFHMKTPSIPEMNPEPSNQIKEEILKHPHVKMVEQIVPRTGIIKRLLKYIK